MAANDGMRYELRRARCTGRACSAIGAVRRNLPLDRRVDREMNSRSALLPVLLVAGVGGSLHAQTRTAAPPTTTVPAVRSRSDTIPFTLRGSRIYLQGRLNGPDSVAIQFDLGAGTQVVNAMSSNRLQLVFDRTQMVSNSQGTNAARRSARNALTIGPLSWTDLPITEVGNMKPDEDLIVGNGPFRDKVLEIDYDKLLLIVHDRLPAKAATFRRQPVRFVQDRPLFEASFTNGGHRYDFWFLFDTGRDGSMLIGEDLTGINGNWERLVAFQMVNGRKIVRLDATIGGEVIKDVVTNAADPSKPGGRPTLFGNVLLNHFNVILDNQQSALYLKPNSRVNEPYSKYSDEMLKRQP